MVAQFERQDDYFLGRDWLESIRLDAQHLASIKRTGWLLHPRLTDHIKANSDNPGFRVADLACGTGNMSLDLHGQFPELSISALDLSSKQFPVPWTVPPQIEFGELDLLKDIPEKFIEAFDIIHIRFIALALIKGSADKLITNLKSMLKPGGWLQWQDIQKPYMTEVDSTTLELSQDQMEGVEKVYSSVGLDSLEWFQTAEEFVSKNGFEKVQKFVPPLNKAAMQATTRVVLLAYLEGQAIAKKYMSPEVAAIHAENFRTIEEKVANGTQFGYHTFIITARKPLAK